MPAQQKKLLFCTAGLLSLACALGAAAAVGSQLWVRGSILCSTGALLVNASGPELHKFIGAIQYGLFSGQRVRQCGLGGRPLQFSCEYRGGRAAHTPGPRDGAAPRSDTEPRCPKRALIFRVNNLFYGTDTACLMSSGTYYCSYTGSDVPIYAISLKRIFGGFN